MDMLDVIHMCVQFAFCIMGVTAFGLGCIAVSMAFSPVSKNSLFDDIMDIRRQWHAK